MSSRAEVWARIAELEKVQESFHSTLLMSRMEDDVERRIQELRKELDSMAEGEQETLEQACRAVVLQEAEAMARVLAGKTAMGLLIGMTVKRLKGRHSAIEVEEALRKILR